MKTNHIHASSRAEAWAAADSVFPCDYMHDGSRSSRAGYDVYFSTNPEVYAWISDLGNRLEVNLQDGSTVNVWIDEPQETEADAYNRFQNAVYDALSGAEEEEETMTAEEAQQAVSAAKAAQRMNTEPLYIPEVCQRVTVCINGGSLARNDDERSVYEAMKRGQPCIEFEILTRYAEQHNIPWGGISRAEARYYPHGSSGSGHYIVSGYISGRIGAEMEFLASCAAVMAEEIRERRR